MSGHRLKGSWDMGLDFHYLRDKFIRGLRRAERTGRVKRYCYTAILLIQLRNGSRVGEAVRAFQEYLRTGRPEVQVPVEKRRDGARRLMVIPEEVDRKPCLWLADEDKDRVTDRVKHFAKRVYHINTHSIRYAFITNLLREGVNATLVAKVTGHVNLNHILTYTQRQAAEDLLRRMDF